MATDLPEPQQWASAWADQTDGGPSPTLLHPHVPLGLLGDDECLCGRAESRYLSSQHPFVAKQEAIPQPRAPGDAGAWALGEGVPSKQSWRSPSRGTELDERETVAHVSWNSESKWGTKK